MDFHVGSFGFPSILDDFVHGVAAVNRGRHLADKSSGCNIISGSESVGAHEVLAVLQPVEETNVAFVLTEWFVAADANEKAEDFGVLVGVDGRIVEASYILGDCISGRNVTFHGEGTAGRFLINGEEQACWINFLECTKEFFEEWFDGVVRRVIGRAIDVDAEVGLDNSHGIASRMEEGCRGMERAVGRGRWEAGIANRCAMVNVVHRVDRREMLRRN
jgi:hypothetical protein